MDHSSQEKCKGCNFSFMKINGEGIIKLFSLMRALGISLSQLLVACHILSDSFHFLKRPVKVTT